MLNMGRPNSTDFTYMIQTEYVSDWEETVKKEGLDIHVQ